MNLTKNVESSRIRVSTLTKFVDACNEIGEDKVLSILKEAQSDKEEKIKRFIVETVTAAFDMNKNFFNSNRLTYFTTHHSLCFAVIILQFKRNFNSSYQDICKDLKTRIRNSSSFYMNKLNNLREKDETDRMYLKLMESIDKEIKNFREKQSTKNIESNG